jgi:hypothetical protein
MIYIGKFLHATDQQNTQETDRRHGEFNLIIEAENENSATDKFKERIKGFRETSDLFQGDCFGRSRGLQDIKLDGKQTGN